MRRWGGHTGGGGVYTRGAPGGTHTAGRGSTWTLPSYCYIYCEGNAENILRGTGYKILYSQPLRGVKE